ncbi:hypothetical protein COB52_01575 [Candidatus Kaiserbacteria bacterium]|nr:MAG: hypothetical protein COB52_01575 [Candidatus Kaiserbacteria bacterium]
MKFQTHTLKNGLKVLLSPSSGEGSVTIMAMTGTGSRYESEKENGISHFLEHMVFKGSKNYPNMKSIAEELDGVGGMFNAFTGKDHTAYYSKVDKRHFETAFNVVSDIFLNPKFPAAEIKREKGTIIEEINMYKDIPVRNVLDDADETIFGKDNPLGRTIIGSKKNILAFTRKDFVTYFEKNYVAGNSAICITGSFSEKKALSMAKKTFANMRVGDVPRHEEYVHEQNSPRINLHYKKTDQTHMVVCLPSYELNNKKEVIAEVLSTILGGGMSSRLFAQVRERRGLAYYVRADQDSYTDIGSLCIRAGVSNTAVNEALKVILNEVSSMKKGVSAKELKKAKEYIKGTTALSLDTTDAQAAHIGYTTLVRKSTKDLSVFNKAIDKVTAKQVKDLAKELLVTNKLNLTIIGPHKDEKKFLKLLKV